MSSDFHCKDGICMLECKIRASSKHGKSVSTDIGMEVNREKGVGLLEDIKLEDLVDPDASLIDILAFLLRLVQQVGFCICLTRITCTVSLVFPMIY